MGHNDHDHRIDRFTHGIIRRKVNQLIGRAGFTEQDRKDLEQDIILRLLQSLPSFDADKAHRNVFTTTVVERYVANILRNKRAEKRDHRRVSSLNVTIASTEDGPTELSETVGQRELDNRRFCHPRSSEELLELAQDVANAVKELPEELQALTERLRSHSIAEIARETGIPRTTLYESIYELRRRFESTGLRDYLSRRADFGP